MQYRKVVCNTIQNVMGTIYLYKKQPVVATYPLRGT